MRSPASKQVYYVGALPKMEKTGGEKYMNEVVTFLRNRVDLVPIDTGESETFKDRVNRFNFRSIKAQFLSNLWAIKKAKVVGKGEVIIMNSYLRHRLLFFALWMRKIKKCNLVIFVNAIYHHSRGSNLLNTIDRIITRILLRQASLVIANSQATKDEMMALGIDKRLIEVIYPRLDMLPDTGRTDERNGNAGFDILFVGYCEPFKELHVLIRALGRLKNLPLTLHIIGDHEGEPEYVSGIRNEIVRSGIENNVIFHGRMDHENLSRWLKGADLFVSPSRGEGYGRALAEAMFFGLPVIGADRGASKELIEHGSNGYLFESGNDASLAEHIRLLYHSPELREQFGRRSKEIIEGKVNRNINIGEQFYNLLEDRLHSCFEKTKKNVSANCTDQLKRNYMCPPQG